MAGTAHMLEDTVTALVEQKKYATLKDILITMNAVDIAALFSEIPAEKLPLLFRLLPKELAADTFVEMDSDAQQLIIRGFSDVELRAVLDELYMDDAVDIIEEMPANVVKRILRQASPEMRKMINELLQYPEDSAGSIMTTEFVDLRPEMTVEEAIEHIRHTGVDKETINTCYVTAPDRKLIGMITIRTLILARVDERLEAIMEPNVISVSTLEDQETVAQMLGKYDFLSMPVVDGENRLVGIVTVDDAMDVIEEEATEDIAKMAAITPVGKPYLKTSPEELWKSRIPWLLLMMVSATFTSMIIRHFEAALAAQVALTAFIPMLMGTGGNAGSQTSATVIRALSIGDVKLSDVLRVVLKEARVAVLCGCTLAVLNFVKLLVFDRVSVMVSAVVSITMALTVLFAKLAGAALPMLAKKLGFDPAVVASPFLTTIVDTMSLLIYFLMAGLLLGV